MKFIRNVVLTVRGKNSKKIGYHEIYREKLRMKRDKLTLKNKVMNNIQGKKGMEEKGIMIVAWKKWRKVLCGNLMVLLKITVETESWRNEITILVIAYYCL